MANIFVVIIDDFVNTDDRNERREWFKSETDMHQFLCGTVYAYASKSGVVMSHVGEAIGEWYEAVRIK